MDEEVVFRYAPGDFLREPSGLQISMMMSVLFRDAVRDIVTKTCGDRMKHPQIATAHKFPELTFTVPADARNIFLRTFNAEIAPAITRYLSAITV